MLRYKSFKNNDIYLKGKNVDDVYVKPPISAK